MLDQLPRANLTFDYSSLPARHTKRIRQLADGIRSRMRRTAEELVAIGRDLIEVKDSLPHGAFGPWLQAEFGWSDRTARRLMAVAENLGNWKSDIMSDLPPTALLHLAGAPEPARQEIAERLTAGERLRIADVERIVRNARGGGAIEGQEARSTMPTQLPGLAGLRAMANRARDERGPEIVRRLAALEEIMAGAEQQAAEKGRVGKGEVERAAKSHVKWLRRALEELTDRKPKQEFYPTAIPRHLHDEGIWRDCAALISMMDEGLLQNTSAKELPGLVGGWRRTLRQALGKSEA